MLYYEQLSKLLESWDRHMQSNPAILLLQITVRAYIGLQLAYILLGKYLSYFLSSNVLQGHDILISNLQWKNQARCAGGNKLLSFTASRVFVATTLARMDLSGA